MAIKRKQKVNKLLCWFIAVLALIIINVLVAKLIVKH
jgi:t-SNARE complex subunit (syntaxin)